MANYHQVKLLLINTLSTDPVKCSHVAHKAAFHITEDFLQNKGGHGVS